MYSEVDYLIKMLEYCFNNNNPVLAKKIIDELATHKAKVIISSEPKYECSSHFYNFSQKSIHKDKTNIYYFENCNHFVCKFCMKKYIEENFRKHKTDHKYICPGCSAFSLHNPSVLDYREPYFSEVIPINYFHYYEELRKIQLSNEFSTKCYFVNPNQHQINCVKNCEVYGIQGCEHAICINCKIIYIFQWGTKPETELMCPDYPQCQNRISHESIRQTLSTVETNPNYTNYVKNALKKLVLKDTLIVNCPSCDCLNELSNCRGRQKCEACDHYLCCLCGNIFHSNIPCFIAKERINEYKEIECRHDSNDEDLRNKFIHARSLFSGELHEEGAKRLVEASGIKLIVKKVIYIYNPLLIDKYESLKNDVKNKGGDTNDIFVFHSTKADVYPKICKNGFKIGGIDIEIKIGKTYGYGIYTAADPTLSIHYYKKKSHPRKLLICKAFVGRESKKKIDTPNELEKTEFNSFKVEGERNRSNIYVFFQREIVLPLYLVDFD